MTQSIDLSNLDRHIRQSLTGIELLYVNQFDAQAKYCTYILIDQLAWLISGSETQVNVYFKSWVKEYFIKYYPQITPEELWASRNGMLHNHSSISRDIVNQKVARQLFFLDNLKHQEDIDPKFNDPSFFVVNTSRFILYALLGAVNDFGNDLRSGNVPDIEDVKDKLGKFLAEVKPN